MSEIRNHNNLDGGQVKFSERVRTAAKRLGTFTARELADEAGVMTKAEKRNISAYIRMYLEHGVIRRIEPDGAAKRAVGCRPCPEKYRYVQKPKKVTDRQRMWNVVRRMKGPFFFMDELEQMTGIKRRSIKKFCMWIVKAGYAKRIKPGHYKRIGKYQVDVPPDGFSCDRMRQYRKTKSQAEQKRVKK